MFEMTSFFGTVRNCISGIIVLSINTKLQTAQANTLIYAMPTL